jgi:hypothetical protein
MTKKLPVSPKPATTHFEQVPVKVVKKTLETPSGRPASHADGGHFHGVQFYKDPDSLCDIVGAFIGEGLEQGALAVVIATPEHTARIEECLRRRGTDVESSKRLGCLATLDAHETLELFMKDGMPDPGAFRQNVGELLTTVRHGREQRPIRAYGEMVNVLWKDGREAAAIRLETLWNQLAGTHDFDLLCAYSMGNFYKGAALEEIKSQHSHVVPGEGGGDAPTLPAASA